MRLEVERQTSGDDDIVWCVVALDSVHKRQVGDGSVLTVKRLSTRLVMEYYIGTALRSHSKTNKFTENSVIRTILTTQQQQQHTMSRHIGLTEYVINI